MANLSILKNGHAKAVRFSSLTLICDALGCTPADVEREVALAPGQTLEVGHHHFRFDGVDRVQGPNYLADRGNVVYIRDGREVRALHPEKRHYAGGGQVMTDAAIRPSALTDVYVALGEPLGDGAWAVRAHIKPFVRWIWTGAGLMALGGIVVAFDRRFRRKPSPNAHRRRERTPEATSP